MGLLFGATTWLVGAADVRQQQQFSVSSHTVPLQQRIS